MQPREANTLAALRFGAATAAPVAEKQQSVSITIFVLSTDFRMPATQIGLTRFGLQTGDRMGLAADNQTTQLDERQSQDSGNQQSLMTPARRAALDALEREFHDLLNAQPREAA